jgi:hypothetical protein
MIRTTFYLGLGTYRVELPTIRFQGWQTTSPGPTRSLQRMTLEKSAGHAADPS